MKFFLDMYTSMTSYSEFTNKALNICEQIANIALAALSIRSICKIRLFFFRQYRYHQNLPLLIVSVHLLCSNRFVSWCELKTIEFILSSIVARYTYKHTKRAGLHSWDWIVLPPVNAIIETLFACPILWNTRACSAGYIGCTLYAKNAWKKGGGECLIDSFVKRPL